MSSSSGVKLKIRLPARPKQEEREPETLVKREPQEPQPDFGWSHPSELPYLSSYSGSIPEYITSRALLTIPRRNQLHSNLSFITLTKHSGEQIRIPVRYRVPLLWILKFTYTSLGKDPLTALHYARLVDGFLSAVPKDVSRTWRYAPLDRALVRIRAKWVRPTPEDVKEYYETKAGRSEGGFWKGQDIIHGFDWKRWALRGCQNIALTEEEANEGINAERFLSLAGLSTTITTTSAATLGPSQLATISPPTTPDYTALLGSFTSTCASLTAEIRALRKEVRELKASERSRPPPPNHDPYAQHRAYQPSSPMSMHFNLPHYPPAPDHEPEPSTGTGTCKFVPAHFPSPTPSSSGGDDVMEIVKKEPSPVSLSGPIKSQRKMMMGRWVAAGGGGV